MSDEKRKARAIALENEIKAGEEYLRDSDRRAFALLFSMPEYAEARNVFCYLGVGTEPDTRVIIERALGDGKTVALPRISGHGVMEARTVSDLSAMDKGTFGIPEPPCDSPIMPKGEIDLVIVPAAAFDKDGYRIGKGGGYYDRFLAGCTAVSVGITREKLVWDAVPVDGHDLPVDILITEEKVRKIRGGG